MHGPVCEKRCARHVPRVLEDREQDEEGEDVRKRDPEARLEGEHDRAEHHVHDRGKVEGRERLEQKDLEGRDDVLLEDTADEEDHEQHRQHYADQDRDAGQCPGEEPVDPRSRPARGRDDCIRDRPGVVVPVGRDDLPGRHPVPPPDLLAHGPGRIEELGIVADPLERLEGRAPVDPEGPGEGVERGLDVVVVRDLDRGRPRLEHGRGQDPVDPLPRRCRGREDGNAEQVFEPRRVDRGARGGRPRRSCSRPRPWAGRTPRPGGGGRGSARAGSRRGPRRSP